MGRAYADGASGSSTWVMAIILPCPSTAVDHTHSVRLRSESGCAVRGDSRCMRRQRELLFTDDQLHGYLAGMADDDTAAYVGCDSGGGGLPALPRPSRTRRSPATPWFGSVV